MSKGRIPNNQNEILHEADKVVILTKRNHIIITTQ